MQPKTKKYLATTVLILLVILLFQRINWPSLPNLFQSKPLLIDNTPILIKEIHNLAQLITISVYDEVVVDSLKPKNLPSLPGLRPVPDKIVLIAKGKVLAGVDLAKIKETNLYAGEDSVNIILPPPQIFSAIINPTDFEIFDEVGEWSESAVTSLKIRAREKIINRALQVGILEKANRKAKAVLENLLKSTGRFKKVMVNYQY